MNNNNKKPFRILFIVFFFLTIMFCGIAYFLQNNVYNKEGKVTGEALITRIDGEDRTYYEYVVDGVKVSKYTSSTTSSLSVGSKTKVYYNPNNIKESFLDFEYYSVISLYISAGVMFVIAFIFILASLKKVKDLKWYRENGMVLSAKITKVFAPYNRPPYFIFCEYDGYDQKYTYKSGPLNKDPRPMLEEYDIKRGTVYVEPDNYKKYMVDTSSIEGKDIY